LAQFVASGAVGLLLKSSPSQELDHGLRRIVAGESYIARDLRAALDAPSAMTTLTMRERQILELVAQGRSNGEIAAVLNISIKTADNHRTNLMRKLEVHSVAELMSLAQREGLV